MKGIRMHITGIRLREYRSYQSLSFEPKSGLNVLVGENAAGKTNILESLFLCALGRSHRTRHDYELIRDKSQEARVTLSINKRTGSHTIACKLRREGKREISIDGMPLSRSGELLGLLHVVMFSPEDLKLIKQGPAERRRFLDMELSQLYPAYYYCLQRYNAALRQRNALLKQKDADESLFAPWEDQLIEMGAELIKRRNDYIKKLTKVASKLHGELSNGKESLIVSYQPSVDGAKQALARALSKGRAKDRIYGSTSQGPHRDDLLLSLNDVDVRAYGSQGQQRTATLSLKLSELLLLKELKREPPVLLLDDVLSELDRARQACLVKAMGNCQTFLTTTALSGLKDAGVENMAVYQVEGGNCVLLNG